MVSEDEKKVLDIISKRHLVRKSELVEILKSNGTALRTIEDLLNRRLIVSVAPLGENTYAITKDGIKSLKD